MNSNQLEILSDLLKLVGDKLQFLEKEYSDYTIHNMVDWLKNSEVDEGVKVKHISKDDLGEGIVRNINLESTYPVEVNFSGYPEYVDCVFWELEVIK